MGVKHSDHPKYSLIVATYNRLDEMIELTQSMRQLEFDRSAFELVVVDDGSSDGTKDFMHAVDLPFEIQYHFQQNQGPGAARNKAMQYAKGEYFIFIDSDVILPANYLAEIDRSVKVHHWDAFGGPDDCHPDFPPLLKAINYSMTSFLGTGGTRGSEKSVTKFYPRSFNMGIHRRVFDAIGGMNDLRHGQDMDFSARIYEAGYKVGLIKDAVVFHKRRTSLRKFYKQIFNWGIARINLGRMYPEMLKAVHLLPAALVATVVLVLLLSIIVPSIRPILWLLLLGAVSIATLAWAQSFSQYRSRKVAGLSIITLFIQVFAYGFGTWSGLYQWMLGKKRAEGFTRDYYK